MGAEAPLSGAATSTPTRMATACRTIIRLPPVAAPLCPAPPTPATTLTKRSRPSLCPSRSPSTTNCEIIYGALNGNTGDTATVGTQRDTGSHFTQSECNTGGLVDGLQLNFVYASGCPSPTPTPTPTASPIACDNYVTTTDTGSI